MTKKIVLVLYGTRPEAVKLAPVIKGLDESAQLEAVVAVSGQHREMVDQVHELMGVTPHYDLELFSHGQSLGDITSRALSGYASLISRVNPDAILLQGDTSTALAGALAGFYAAVPVIHVEAGLRTGNLAHPFPEEFNRRTIAIVARLHLAPTAGAAANLRAEGVEADSIVVTGNTVIDALLIALAKTDTVSDAGLSRFLSMAPRSVLVTAHRRESWGERMDNITAALSALAESYPGVGFVVPMHRNPRVRDSLWRLAGLPNVYLTEPLDYADMVATLRAVDIVLTDSGGLQEEAPTLGKPVLVLRETSERHEAIAAGVARLVGTDTRAIVQATRTLLDDAKAYAEMAQAINPYGDGLAAERSVAAAEALLSGSDFPQPFVVAATSR